MLLYWHMNTTALDNRRERERCEIRFRWLAEQIERLRREKPYWPDEDIDAVYDKVKEALLTNPDFGRTRAAIWGAIRKQAGWVAGDRKRIRENPDGSPRNHPRAAGSLNRVFVRSDGSTIELSEIISGPAESQPEKVCERREEVAMIREAARGQGMDTEIAVVGAMVGFRPAEIAEQRGVEVNTIHQRMSRFRTLYRADEEGGNASGQ